MEQTSQLYEKYTIINKFISDHFLAGTEIKTEIKNYYVTPYVNAMARKFHNFKPLHRGWSNIQSIYPGAITMVYVFGYYSKGLCGQFGLFAKDEENKFVFFEPARKFEMRVSNSLHYETVEKEIFTFLETLAKRHKIEALISPSNFLFNAKMNNFLDFGYFSEKTKQAIFDNLIAIYGLEKIDSFNKETDFSSQKYIFNFDSDDSDSNYVIAFLFEYFKEVCFVVYMKRFGVIENIKFFKNKKEAELFISKLSKELSEMNVSMNSESKSSRNRCC